MIRASSLKSAIARFQDLVRPFRKGFVLRGDDGFDTDGLRLAVLAPCDLPFGNDCECIVGRGGVSGAVFACASGIGPGLWDRPALSGLPRKLDLWDRCPLRCGDTGTFQRLASSGNSSSESWYSSSNSLMVFRCGCQEDRLEGTLRKEAGD